MVAILKHVGTADWDREQLNMSIEYTSQLVCASSGDAAKDAVSASSLERVNTLKCFTHGEEGVQSLLSGRDGGTALSQSGKIWCLVCDVVVCDVAIFCFCSL
jgi:hypothetical protein